MPFGLWNAPQMYYNLCSVDYVSEDMGLKWIVFLFRLILGVSFHLSKPDLLFSAQCPVWNATGTLHYK